MSVPMTRPVSQHNQTTHYQGVVSRAASPYFAPPVPLGCQEPNTNWFTIVTADGPHTLEKSGTTGGMKVGANNLPNQTPVARLTRKGG